MRLNKKLVELGVTSRRKADEMIERGLVSVNGELATLGTKVLDTDIIEVDGKVVKNDTSKIILMYYKEKGVICTESDAEKGIRIYDVKEKVDSIFGVNKDNKITFKIRDNENDKDFNVKIKNVQNDFKNRRNVEIKPVSQQEKKQADLIPNSIKWDNTNVNSLIKNRNIDKTQQEKTHSKPIENNNNEQKMTQIFVNLKYKNEQSII